MLNKFDKIYALDTNIIISHPSCLDDLSQNNENLIIIPAVVLKELERFKTEMEGGRGYSAREFGRFISSSEVAEIFVPISKKSLDDFTYVHYISKNNVNFLVLDLLEYASTANDLKIIETVSVVHQLNFEYNEIIFLTNDAYCKASGELNGLSVEAYGRNIPYINTFIKTINNISNAKNLLNTSVINIDPEYEKHWFNYMITSPEGKPYFYLVRDGVFYDQFTDSLFIDLKVPPKGLGQKFMFASIMTNDITVVDAKAGSGKSVCALIAGKALIDNEQLAGIYYIRSPIDSLSNSKQEIGFRKGTMEDKMLGYSYSLFDAIDFIQSKDISFFDSDFRDLSKTDKRALFMNEYNVEVLYLGDLRGRSLDNILLIIDEAQNMSHKDLELILSRAGENCKIIVIGDNHQIDAPYLNKKISGLNIMQNIAIEGGNNINIACVSLESQLRGKFAEFVSLRLYKKEV